MLSIFHFVWTSGFIVFFCIKEFKRKSFLFGNRNTHRVIKFKSFFNVFLYVAQCVECVQTIVSDVCDPSTWYKRNLSDIGGLFHFLHPPIQGYLHALIDEEKFLLRIGFCIDKFSACRLGPNGET